jgi:pyridoxamine 5'-phosphate oxidase
MPEWSLVTGELDLRAMRRRYQLGRLDEADAAPTWIVQFDQWFAAAAADPAVVEVNAMQLATVDDTSRPSVRTVLAKGVTADGVTFFTHYDSPKGRDLGQQPWAAVVFAWLPQQRQVRLTGRVAPISRADTDAYFASRPRGSQVGAWASAATGQSAVVADRAALDREVDAVQARFDEASSLPTPPDWGGYRLEPVEVEFWQGRDNRMHDRLRYRRADDGWLIERLAP